MSKKVNKEKVDVVTQPTPVVCVACEGRGRSPLNQEYKECPECKGTGK